MACDFWGDLVNADCEDTVSIDITSMSYIGETTVSPLIGNGTILTTISTSRDGNYIYTATDNGIDFAQRGTFGIAGDISSVTWDNTPVTGYNNVAFNPDGTKQAMVGNADLHFFEPAPAFSLTDFASAVGSETDAPNIGDHGTYADPVFISNYFGTVTRFTPNPYPTDWDRATVSLGVDAVYDSYGAIFTADGLTMLTWDTEAYTANPDEQFLVQYDLSVPFDITTLTLKHRVSMSSNYPAYGIKGLALKADDSGVYVVGQPITGNNLTIQEFNFT